jgi:hypothetical protein
MEERIVPRSEQSMNWIDLSKERPKEEPKRAIRIKFESGLTGWWGSDLQSQWPSDATHWAEIEPPETDPVRGALRRIVDAVIAEGVTAERFLPRLEEVLKPIAEGAPRSKPGSFGQWYDEWYAQWQLRRGLTPKPDPF